MFISREEDGILTPGRDRIILECFQFLFTQSLKFYIKKYAILYLYYIHFARILNNHLHEKFLFCILQQ